MLIFHGAVIPHLNSDMSRLSLHRKAVIYLGSSEVLPCNFLLLNFLLYTLKMTMQSVGYNGKKFNIFHVVCSALKILQWLSMLPKKIFSIFCHRLLTSQLHTNHSPSQIHLWNHKNARVLFDTWHLRLNTQKLQKPCRF